MNTGIYIWHRTESWFLFYSRCCCVAARENNDIFPIRNGLIKAIIVMSWCQQSRCHAISYYASNGVELCVRCSCKKCISIASTIEWIVFAGFGADYRLDWIIRTFSTQIHHLLQFCCSKERKKIVCIHAWCFEMHAIASCHLIRIQCTFSPSSFFPCDFLIISIKTPFNDFKKKFWIFNSKAAFLCSLLLLFVSTHPILVVACLTLRIH